MFKCIMFTDLHMGVHNHNNIWLDASIVLANELKMKCQENDIEDIIFLGDFFHDRKSINSNVLWYANEFFEILSDIKIHIIIGNHDTYLKNSLEPHSLRSFNKFSNVNIVEDVCKLNEYISLISWNKDFSKCDTPYICGHFDIAGCEISSNFTESKETLKISDFKKFKEVFSGHFHSPNKTKNIFYIGSVMPFTFADVNSPRGYYIMTFTDELNKSFIEFTSCPKYVSIDINEDINNFDINGNIIKLVYDKELSLKDNELLMSRIWDKKPLSVTTDFRNVVEEDEDVGVVDTNFKNTKEILLDYIDKIKLPDHIKKKNLVGFINDILEK